MDEQRGIGLNGKLPWKLPEEMARFRKCTTDAPDGKQNVIIMGRKTWESIGSQPLKGRINIFLTKTKPRSPFAKDSLGLAINTFLDQNYVNDIYIIGGTSVYQQALDADIIDEMLVSHVKSVYKCDTIFPKLKDVWKGKEVFSTADFTQISYKKC